MSYEPLHEILLPEEIRAAIPLPDDLAAIKQERDRLIRDIFERRDDRFLLIIGPCSADNEDADRASLKAKHKQYESDRSQQGYS